MRKNSHASRHKGSRCMVCECSTRRIKVCHFFKINVMNFYQSCHYFKKNIMNFNQSCHYFKKNIMDFNQNYNDNFPCDTNKDFPRFGSASFSLKTDTFSGVPYYYMQDNIVPGKTEMARENGADISQQNEIPPTKSDFEPTNRTNSLSADPLHYIHLKMGEQISTNVRSYKRLGYKNIQSDKTKSSSVTQLENIRSCGMNSKPQNIISRISYLLVYILAFTVTKVSCIEDTKTINYSNRSSIDVFPSSNFIKSHHQQFKNSISEQRFLNNLKSHEIGPASFGEGYGNSRPTIDRYGNNRQPIEQNIIEERIPGRNGGFRRFQLLNGFGVQNDFRGGVSPAESSDFHDKEKDFTDDRFHDR